MRQIRATAVLVILAVGVLTGCSTSDDSAGSSAPATAEPTPIARLNTPAMRLGRSSFCTRLPQVAVDDAVGGTAGRGEAWSNGDKAVVEDGPDGVDDVVDEYGCSWRSGPAVARAWVFARAVTPEQARAVIAQTSRRRGCTSTAGPDFGSPSQRQTCSGADGSVRVRVAGLFTDSWLSCEVDGGPDADAASVARRTDAWCVQVANALNTTH